MSASPSDDDIMHFKIELTLDSGIHLDCDLYECIQFPHFDTGDDEYPVASIGGTLLLVEFKSRWFGITARHITGTGADKFEFKNIMIHSRNRGEMFTPLKLLRSTGLKPLDGNEHIELGDIQDLAIVEVQPDIAQSVPRYWWDPNTFCHPVPKSNVRVIGFLADDSKIETDAQRIVTRTRPFNVRFIHAPERGDDRVLLKARVELP